MSGDEPEPDATPGGPQPDETSGATDATPGAPQPDEGRTARLIGRGLALLAGVVVGLALVFGWTPDPTGPRVELRVLGEAGTAILVEPQRGVEVRAEVDPDGAVVLIAPASAQRPVVEIYAREGTALIQTKQLDLTEGRNVTREAPLALWTPRLDLQTRDDEVRFKWSPMPKGEGYPAARLYSILLTYKKRDGTRAESSLRSEEPSLRISLRELTAQETLPDWDPTQTELELELRAFDPNIRFGPKWIGARHRWTIGESELR